MTYDSRSDTLEHIETVQGFLEGVIENLRVRALYHDQSKLEPPEKEVFDEYTPKLQDTAYGTEEYKRSLTEMGVGLKHHYATNDHHPQHFKSGIKDMDLLQLIEMLADWKAATLRHPDGDLDLSITQNADRFGMSVYLENLLRRTARSMGWL